MEVNNKRKLSEIIDEDSLWIESEISKNLDNNNVDLNNINPYCLFLKHKPRIEDWYKINKEGFPTEIITLHKNNLSIQQHISTKFRAEPLPIKCFIETPNELWVPYY